MASRNTDSANPSESSTITLGDAEGNALEAATGTCQPESFLRVARVMSAIRVPHGIVEILPPELAGLLATCSQQSGRELSSSYLKSLENFSAGQQSNIRCLLETIRKMMESSEDLRDEIVSELSNILSDVRCFADHYLLLQKVCLFSGSKAGQADELLNILLRKLWEHMSSSLPSHVLQVLSHRLFGDCADNMSTHANACICYGLDVVYNLFGGSLIDDPNCPVTPLVTMHAPSSRAMSACIPLSF